MNKVRFLTKITLAVSISIEAKAKTFGINDPSGEALEGAAMKAIAT